MEDWLFATNENVSLKEIFPPPETNGDVLAHIAYPAQLILAEKSLWNEKAGDGRMYRQVAEQLVRECDKTIDSFILPYWVDTKTNRRTPASRLATRSDLDPSRFTARASSGLRAQAGSPTTAAR